MSLCEASVQAGVSDAAVFLHFPGKLVLGEAGTGQHCFQGNSLPQHGSDSSQISQLLYYSAFREQQPHNTILKFFGFGDFQDCNFLHNDGFISGKKFPRSYITILIQSAR